MSKLSIFQPNFSRTPNNYPGYLPSLSIELAINPFLGGPCLEQQPYPLLPPPINYHLECFTELYAVINPCPSKPNISKTHQNGQTCVKNGLWRPPPAPFSASLLMTSSNMVYWPSSPPAQPILDLYEHFAGNKKQFEIWLDLWLILWPRGGWRGETSRSTKPPGWEIQRIIYSQTLQELNLAGKIFLLWHRISFWGELWANTRSRTQTWTQTCHTPGYEGTNGGQNLYLLHFGPGSMLNKTSDMSDYTGPHILYNRNIGSDNCDIFQS